MLVLAVPLWLVPTVRRGLGAYSIELPIMKSSLARQKNRPFCEIPKNVRLGSPIVLKERLDEANRRRPSPVRGALGLGKRVLVPECVGERHQRDLERPDRRHVRPLLEHIQSRSIT